ncbi:MAG: DUF1844 domain-containing protein [Planctomycetes bacterium]|nr:DUF1844 domain-containing protein [Planctomycetota bacterium]
MVRGSAVPSGVPEQASGAASIIPRLRARRATACTGQASQDVGSRRTSVSAEELPEPAFEHLVLQLFTTAGIELGEMPNPVTGETHVSLPRARFNIGMLEMLQEKTEGHLTAEEEKLLKHALHGLRVAWLRHSQEGA